MEKEIDLKTEIIKQKNQIAFNVHRLITLRKLLNFLNNEHLKELIDEFDFLCKEIHNIYKIHLNKFDFEIIKKINRLTEINIETATIFLENFFGNENDSIRFNTYIIESMELIELKTKLEDNIKKLTYEKNKQTESE